MDHKSIVTTLQYVPYLVVVCPGRSRVKELLKWPMKDMVGNDNVQIVLLQATM